MRCFAALSTLLMLMLMLMHSVQSLTQCGRCKCDRLSITCTFGRGVSDDSLTLTEFLPSESELRSRALEPEKFEELHVNCHNSPAFRNQKLHRSLLSHLSALTTVSIVKCDIVSIDSDAFVDTSALSSLDLTENRLQSLPSGLLVGRSMAMVRLSGNVGIQMMPNVFRQVRLERLIMKNCGLTEFPLTSLLGVYRLNSLILSNNQIKVVPIAAKQLILKLRHFYLDGNPLSCTCVSRWLRETVQWERVAPNLSNPGSTTIPICQSPYYVMGVPITRLEPQKFVCQAPQIRKIELNVGTDKTDVLCSAWTEQAEMLRWTYRHTSSGALEFGDDGIVRTGKTFMQTIRRTPGKSQDKFDLRASISDGQSANVSVSVVWLKPPVTLSSVTTTRPRGRGDSGIRVPPDASTEDGTTATRFGPLSRKQFTLVELILAVAGTFMSTSLIFLLTCQFCRWYSRRDKKRWLGYAGQPYGCGYPSQRRHQQQQPPPSHEYDVPRIDQPCLPKPPQAELEFLDYTGHTMVYSHG